MRAVVTGAAGFIGSHLSDRLLADGHEVAGIDSFNDFYARAIKEQNLARARMSDHFVLHELDLATDGLAAALSGSDTAFHIAGRSGLGGHRRAEFDRYVRDNIVATQRLLDASIQSGIRRFVYVSSYSIYGDAERHPTREATLPLPLSTYGVTKLAAENLVLQYAHAYGLQATVLRLFTIYGPRQRPDMAIASFIRALAGGHVIEIFGDGDQTRDLTFVGDAVEAIVRSARPEAAGQVINVGGGARTSINAVLRTLETITGLSAIRRHLPPARGDQRHSAASINRARQLLEWEPRVSLTAGLTEQWAAYQRSGWELEAASVAV